MMPLIDTAHIERALQGPTGAVPGASARAIREEMLSGVIP